MAFRVLDSSAFYAGIPFGSNEPSYTTSLVYDEIKHIKKNHDAVDILIETGRLTISNPESEFIEIVRNTANESGDLHELSVEDISIIALSLKLGAELITDDFAVSNVAKNLNIQVFPVMTDGIKNIVSWTYYCPGCNNNFSESIKCPKCGNTLKRKNLKK
ncbi:MAG TPA: nucleotide-binding protein [Candidatus Nitrosopelagicus sp.]|nr:nucleotide-binding protein [Candidatus Nitrosopelagicus sp.]